MRRVAICQPEIIRGGRLSVILDIIQNLNDHGIIPDILTRKLHLDLDASLRAYGKSLQANLRLVPLPPRPREELRTLIFNYTLRRYASDYDLLINTSNSLEFLPTQCQVLSYVFFPRKRRYLSEQIDLHLPDARLPRWSAKGMKRSILRQIYRLSKPSPGQKIVCMTQFTRDALLRDYDFSPDLPIVYPAVNLEQYRQPGNLQAPFGERHDAIVTIGRFSRAKRQVEQIKLAKNLPDTQFHIIGFINSAPYYEECERLVREHQIHNVQLHPELDFTKMVSYLHGAKYFLHTLINEPFGLTAVQAVAAGCLPIVHDSGGQRETITEPSLRYRELADVPEVLNRIRNTPDTTIQQTIADLQAHVQKEYSQELFQQKICSILKPLIY